MANHLLESTSTSRSASLRSKPKHAAADASSALESAASRLESESASWTDLSKACLHPRSARTLDGLWQGTHAFDGFGEGSEWCRSEDRREDVRDVVRRWAEECGALAGFHVAAEDLGGFGGVATAALEEIRDEYGRNVPVCVFSLRPPRCACAKASESDSASARRVSMLNEGLATATFAPETDAYIPVCASAWTGARTLAATGVNPRGRYHASAIAAAAMDVATTPWRVGGGRERRWRGEFTSRRRASLCAAPAPFVALTVHFPLAAVPDPREAAEAAEAARRRRRDAERSGSGSGIRDSGFGASGSFGRDENACRRRRTRRARRGGPRESVPLRRRTSHTHARRVVEFSVGFELGRVPSPRGVVRGRGAAKDATTAAAPRRGARRAGRRALAQRARAPRLRFASAAPLPLPLPFPRVFGTPPGPNPSSAPAMARLAAGAFGGRFARRRRGGDARRGVRSVARRFARGASRTTTRRRSERRSRRCVGGTTMTTTRMISARTSWTTREGREQARASRLVE